MTTFKDLQDFIAAKDYKMIIAADAEPFVHKIQKDDQTVSSTPAGGVAVALEPIAKSAHAIVVGRGKTEEDKKTVDAKGKIEDKDRTYTLKRLFFSNDDIDNYYYGFANQTLWPLCHVAFELPHFSDTWYAGFKKVNEAYAKAIKEEISGKTFIWINDYQLSLVPQYLGSIKDAIVAMFWHIPWPTWEVFRILPQKKEILASLLQCDFVAFHRGYQARNFLDCVNRELEARIDLETNRVYYNNHITTVAHLPMGIDVDVIKSLIVPIPEENLLGKLIKKTLNLTTEDTFIDSLFAKYKVILGVDRLDYTKGLLSRLQAVDMFFEQYPQYKEKVTYLEIMAPSREVIPAYMQLKKQFIDATKAINHKYATADWQPVNLIHGMFSRNEIMNFYSKSAVCMVTPRDDGMNLVSKEFVIAASLAKNPGMLVLSQFAGSAIDLTEAIIVNPYNTQEVVSAMKKALEMPQKEKRERIDHMAGILEERNIYTWAENFIRDAELAAEANK